MKTKTAALLAAIGLATTPFPTLSASFDSGSDGSYGAITLANNASLTLDAPPDGVFRCTTITVGYRAALSFRPNALNTPIYLLATGDVTIDGSILVNGENSVSSLAGSGGPGGFPGGQGGIAGGADQVGGDGAGPGSGKNLANHRSAAFAYASAENSNTYGNALLVPIIGGSGGAGGDGNAQTPGDSGGGGGGGGGAIALASNTRISVNNPGASGYGIQAKGGTSSGGSRNGGGGSGGAIRLIAPIVTGNGTLDTSRGVGDYGGSNPRSFASPGRIRVDCLDDFAYRSLAFVGSFTRGSQMYVFPPLVPRLDIIEAAGMPILLGITNAVTIALPFGSPTNHTVTVRAESFTNDVPVRIAVTPDTGPALTFDGTIPLTSNPATNTFDIVIPAGTISRIDAWTR